MKLTAVGVVIGVGGAIALTRLMHSLLFNTSATDPFTFILISLLLSLSSLLRLLPPRPARREGRPIDRTALRIKLSTEPLPNENRAVKLRG